MKFLSLIGSLLVIGLLVYQQLGHKPSVAKSPSQHTDVVTASDAVKIPKVPTQPGELKTFQKDMNTFMNEAAKETAKKVEAAENL